VLVDQSHKLGPQGGEFRQLLVEFPHSASEHFFRMATGTLATVHHLEELGDLP
jgi:hypothetical protein